MDKMNKEQVLEALPQFTGTEHWYKYQFGTTLTDGTKFIADSCGVYWLMDIIASMQFKPKARRESFWHCKLTCRDLPKKNRRIAHFEMTDGNNTILHRQNISLTDFPLDSIELYAEDNGEGTRVILLPSEH